MSRPLRPPALGGAVFGLKLRTLREKAGLTVSELGRRTGISKQAVSGYELNQRTPSWEIVQAFALALGVSTEEFRDLNLTIPLEPAETVKGQQSAGKRPQPGGKPRQGRAGPKRGSTAGMAAGKSRGGAGGREARPARPKRK